MTGIFNRKNRASERDWTQGSLTRNLLSLSWPMMISSSLNMLGPTIDMIWVGKLGMASVASVGVAGMAVMVVSSLVMGLFIGLQAMVARSIGAGDRDTAVHVVRQALVICSIASIIIAAIGIFFSEWILKLAGMGPDVITAGASYLRIQFVGMVTMSFQWMTNSTMVASGDTVRPMWISLFGRFVHIVLCPFLVFGWWFFPHLGVNGAAITGVFSQGLGAALGLWFLFSGRTRLKMTLKGFYIDPGMIWRIIRIGIPAAVTNMERSFGQMVFLRLVAGFGTSAVAAYTVGQRVDNLLQMPASPFGQAAGVLAAQNLGAGKPERAERVGWLALGWYTGAMVFVSLAIWFWAEKFAGIFTPNADLQNLAGLYLRITIVQVMAFGLINVLMQCLNSVGDTLPAMLAVLVTLWGIQLPVGYALSKFTSLGLSGVFWGMSIGAITRGSFYGVYFKMGRWKHKKV